MLRVDKELFRPITGTTRPSALRLHGASRENFSTVVKRVKTEEYPANGESNGRHVRSWPKPAFQTQTATEVAVSLDGAGLQSQLNAPPVWYSITRVSKKFFSFFRSINSDIQGNGLVAPGNS